MLNIRTLSLILTAMFLLTVYLRQLPPNMDKPIYESSLVKKIVAYSLEKRIEMESESVVCTGQNRGPGDGDEEAVNINNNEWRLLEGTDYYLYSVHEDRRLAPYNYVRVLGMAKGKWNATLFCNLISSDGNLHVTRATRTVIWSDNWVDIYTDTNFTPILFSCRIPAGNIRLYLSHLPCTYKNLVYSKSKTKNNNVDTHDVTICVKPLDFDEDISRKLVEWIEMNKIVGANGFRVYVKSVHGNVRKVLEWYGKHHRHFRLIEFVHGPMERNVWQKRKNEILIYNDCFYSNLHSSFVLPVDIDEIIIPKNGPTWNKLFEEFPENYASYSIRNAFYLQFNQSFFGDFKRTVFSDMGDSGKSFVSTKNALTVFNHYALHALKPGISRCYFVPEDLAQMNHYRKNCPKLLPECAKYLSSPRIYDDIILKYKNTFEENFLNVWNKLKP